MKRTIAQLIEAGFHIKLPPAPEPISTMSVTSTKWSRGHPRMAWNTYTYPNGKRECLACRKVTKPQRVPKHWAEWGLEG